MKLDQIKFDLLEFVHNADPLQLLCQRPWLPRGVPRQLRILGRERPSMNIDENEHSFRGMF